MLRRISIQDLKPGMTIVDVIKSWSQTLSMDKVSFIKDQKMIQRLQEVGIKEIFIDTEKTKKIKIEIDESAKKIEQIDESVEKITEIDELRQELGKADLIRSEAQKIVSSIMIDVRNGEKIVINELNNVVEKVVDSILRNQYALVGLAQMQKKNSYIFEHAVSSCALMVAYANVCGYDNNEQQELGVGAILHDIGMMNIPTKILNKPGELNKSERIELRKHVEYGYNILADILGISESSLVMALQHHERWDGNGYPKRLKGKEISQIGQMVAIVDVYDAITTDKGYKKGISPSKALREMFEKSDIDFNGELIQKFIQSVGLYPFGTIVSLKNKLFGIVIDVRPIDLLHPVLRIIYDPQKGGLITPYDLDLQNYIDDPDFKISNVELKEKLFFKTDDITKIIGLKNNPLE